MRRFQMTFLFFNEIIRVLFLMKYITFFKWKLATEFDDDIIRRANFKYSSIFFLFERWVLGKRAIIVGSLQDI